MERKRDELVSTGAVFSVLVGKVKEALQPLPQGVHHFTRLDQVNQLVGASEADADMGFMTRLMALCSLPRSNPGNRLQFKRVNGPYMLIITATGKHKLPFGNLPRLLLAWVCTEAVRTQSRELVLGSSLSEFMRELGMQTSGGSARGDRRRLQNQMQRLFSCTVAMIHEDKHGEKFVSSAIAEQGEFWWDPARPDDRTLWESKIELGEKFFTEIIQHPVPLDMNILKALKRSSLGLDIYLWLVYRTFALKKPQRVSWKSLYRQFGVDPAQAEDNITVQNFRKDCLRELKKIKTSWPALNYSTAKGVLILNPSAPSILPAQIPLLG